MGQWTGVKPTPEQHRTADLARIADALERLERIVNRPRFIRLSSGHVFNIDHIRALFIDPDGGRRLYLGEDVEAFYPLFAEDMAHLLKVLEPTEIGR